jgi:seryl-tRNA(Sec) selenium transferase
MISSELRQQINQELKVIPGYRQVILAQFDWIGELEKVAIKFELNADQERILVVETALVLMDAANPEQYALELKNQAQLPVEKVEKIAKDVIDRVMTRVQKELDEMMKVDGQAIVAQMRRELGDSDILESTGLKIVSEDAIMSQGQNPVSVATNPSPVTSVTDSNPTHDPYHEPVE